jgi:mannitol-1-/sugar-/sorbitol-6-phosphatase
MDEYRLGTATRAVLLDVDGVLLETGSFFEEIWADWARRRALDPDVVVAHTRGRRTDDVLREVAPQLDPAGEHRLLDDLVLARLGEIRAAAGAVGLIAAIQDGPWAIVTSGSRWFIQHCFGQVGLPLPPVAVCAEDVRRGKPAADGYRAAARLLRVDPAACLVVEDSPAGVRAGRDAGCTVIALATTVPAEQLHEADACFPDLAAAVGPLLAAVRKPAVPR